jgi:hypothetical protein
MPMTRPPAEVAAEALPETNAEDDDWPRYKISKLDQVAK